MRCCCFRGVARDGGLVARSPFDAWALRRVQSSLQMDVSGLGTSIEAAAWRLKDNSQLNFHERLETDARLS